MEIVHVVYHHDPKAWWADSPSVPGWTATAETLDELRRLAEDGVRFALDRDDMLIEHVLDYDLPKGALISFDFVARQTVVSATFSAATGGSQPGAHWHAQPA